MGHIQGQSRHQVTLFPETLDDLVPANHLARSVDAFVGYLDLLDLGFTKVDTAATGRPPYHPADLLKLYLYGCMRRIRSSRRLEEACGSDVAFMWLLRRLRPDFKTIANFRKENRRALVKVCRAFVHFCRREGLYGAELVAIDGSKFRAASGRKGVCSRERLQRELAQIEQKIREYLDVLDGVDEEEAAADTGRTTADALSALSRRRRELQALAQDMDVRGARRGVVGEPDARLMRQARGGHEVSYNVQTAVDEKHKLIVSHEVTTACNDQGQLYPMARSAQEGLGVERLDVVADAGYQNAEQAQACEDAGIRAAVPGRKVVNPKGGGRLFDRGEFAYDSGRDCYICPAGEVLRCHRVGVKNNTRYYRTEGCAGCGLRPRCTRSRHRTVCRSVHAAAQERMNARAERHPELMRKRGSLSEHPFGSIKRTMGDGRFLMRGLENVRAEMGLSVLGYNLQRVVNLLGVEVLCARLAA